MTTATTKPTTDKPVASAHALAVRERAANITAAAVRVQKAREELAKARVAHDAELAKLEPFRAAVRVAEQAAIGAESEEESAVRRGNVAVMQTLSAEQKQAIEFWRDDLNTEADRGRESKEYAKWRDRLPLVNRLLREAPDLMFDPDPVAKIAALRAEHQVEERERPAASHTPTAAEVKAARVLLAAAGAA